MPPVGVGSGLRMHRRPNLSSEGVFLGAILQSSGMKMFLQTVRSLQVLSAASDLPGVSSIGAQILQKTMIVQYVSVG